MAVWGSDCACNSVTESECHSSIPTPSPSLTLKRVRYPLTAGWTEFEQFPRHKLCFEPETFGACGERFNHLAMATSSSIPLNWVYVLSPYRMLRWWHELLYCWNARSTLTNASAVSGHLGCKPTLELIYVMPHTNAWSPCREQQRPCSIGGQR